MSSTTATQPSKPLRADAARNRQQLIETASAAFAEHGVDASLEEIAKQAGVGIGTLYRHFPTRHALIEAVYRQSVEALCAGVDDLLADLPADRALAEWMQQFVRYVAVKRGLVGALKEVLSSDSEVFAHSHTLLNDAVAKLVHAGVASGAIRKDVDPMVVLRGVSGFCMVNNNQDGWQKQASGLAELLVDGLRYSAG